MGFLAPRLALGPLAVLVCCSVLGARSSVVAQVDAETPKPVEERAAVKSSGPGITLLDGKTIDGELEAVTAEGFRIAGHDKLVPQYEVQEIRLPRDKSDAAAQPLDATREALVRFRSSEEISARVIEIAAGDDGKLTALLRLSHNAKSPALPELRVPLESLAGFRLREQHAEDPLFESALAKEAPQDDTFFIRRTGLLSVTGTLRGLTAEHVVVERSGRRSRVKRQRIQGVVLAPVASQRTEPDPPAILELTRGGRLPAYITGLTGENSERKFVLRMPGAKASSTTPFPVSAVRRITLASDRVLFLSATDPATVEEKPVVGKPLRYRRDRSVSGDPLTIAGQRYRRGLGVHSYCALDYDLAGQYTSFAAVIGLDDSSKGKGSVTFRVLADGKEIFQKEVAGKAAPERVSLPMENVKTLRLVVDYGADKLDFSDHADWADARVTK